MSEKKVKVLLSTYNGEKYICEQLESIFAQSYPNIEVFVRDDGSQDQTIAILKQYEEEKKLCLLEGENLGFIKSFLQLLLVCGEADYYAYCDQDDIWLPDKIKIAVTALDEQDPSMPVLYFSNYDYYNSKMEYLEHGRRMGLKPSFRNALVDCMPLGISSVFNQTACDSIRRHMPEQCCGHDWWTYLLCAGTGTVIADPQVTVKYRRHEQNVSAGGMDLIRFQIWRFRKFFLNNYFSNIRAQIREFATYYAEALVPEDQRLLQWFLNDRYSFKNALKRMLYPKRYRVDLLDDLMVRFLFLIGKL